MDEISSATVDQRAVAKGCAAGCAGRKNAAESAAEMTPEDVPGAGIDFLQFFAISYGIMVYRNTLLYFVRNEEEPRLGRLR
jgi:hypothetical protein